MKIINSVKEIREELKNLKDKSIGFVPTMGALHFGHKALIDQARGENQIVILSIFVNPTQFLEGEDLQKYPRTFEADKEVAIRSGVDFLFFPKIDEIYSNSDEVQILAPKIGGFILEGASRPNHFNGVLQVVLKLFNIIKPNKAYFGKKDAQQLFLIQTMVKNLFLPIEIIAIDIVRDNDGLALSSRNRYLSKSERELALLLPQSLEQASKLVLTGKRDIKLIKNSIKKVLKNSNSHNFQNFQNFQIDYICFVDRDFKEIQKIQINNSILLVAIRVGNIRLIDNIWF